MKTVYHTLLFSDQTKTRPVFWSCSNKHNFSLVRLLAILCSGSQLINLPTVRGFILSGRPRC